MRFSSTVVLVALAAPVFCSLSATHQIRQVSSSIADCDAPCNSSGELMANCGAGDVSCVCGSAVSQATLACAQCDVQLMPSTQDTLQQAMDDYKASCNSAGFNVGPMSLTGGGTGSGLGTPATAVGTTPGATTTPGAAGGLSSSAPAPGATLKGGPLGTNAASSSHSMPAFASLALGVSVLVAAAFVQ